MTRHTNIQVLLRYEITLALAIFATACNPAAVTPTKPEISPQSERASSSDVNAANPREWQWHGAVAAPVGARPSLPAPGLQFLVTGVQSAADAVGRAQRNCETATGQKCLILHHAVNSYLLQFVDPVSGRFLWTDNTLPEHAERAVADACRKNGLRDCRLSARFDTTAHYDGIVELMHFPGE